MGFKDKPSAFTAFTQPASNKASVAFMPRVDSARVAATLGVPMKLPRLLLSLILAVFVSAAAVVAAPVYELRTYTTMPDKLPALLTRFRDHTTKLFEKHGMVNIGYWTPTDEKDGSANKLVYLLEHKSREAADASWKAFNADPVWQDVRKKSEEAGKIVSKVDRQFLTQTDYAKAMTAGNGMGSRTFELRTYTTPEGKLADLDARFRDHTIALFKKHGMTNLAYFHPMDADKGAANTLVYFLAFPNRDAATASWKAFRDDPVWVKAKEASEKNGKLTTKTESVFLKPTDFSAIK